MAPVRGAESASSSGRWIPVEEVLREARGPKFLGLIERNIVVFIGLHLTAVSILVGANTYLREAFAGLLTFGSAREVLYSISLLLTLGLHTANYIRLYGSDPGWIRFDSKIEEPQLPCQYCRIAPTLRSRHDFNTGQCVHKFDHFCWFLGTSIGDCNHLRFWCFMLAQTFLVLWGIVLAADSLAACLPGRPALTAESCWAGAPLSTVARVVLLVLLCFALSLTGGLLTFHTYLAASNQTTYEVMRGEKVPYLEPFFRGYEGPKQVKLVGLELCKFVGRVVKGRGPPVPFSSHEGPFNGVSSNLDLFFFGSKPLMYRYTELTPSDP